ADEIDQVRAVCDYVSDYRHFFDAAVASGARGGTNGHAPDDPTSAIAATLEDRFFATEVHLNKQSFLQQFQYSIFFSYFKLKEQEIRSLTWIAECIAQDARDRIQDFITIF
ncbi:H(+)-transporting V0 sector ATPase subunit d, partial [Serendipita sp. 400]